MNKTDETLQIELQKMVTTVSSTIGTEKTSSDGVKAVVAPQVDHKNLDKMSALQDLSRKIELCLLKQQKLRFVTKEIEEIIKKKS